MTPDEWNKLKAFLDANKIPYELSMQSFSGRLGSNYAVILPLVHYKGSGEDD